MNKKYMENNRQKLLENLVEKFTNTIKYIHRGQGFPFGNAMLNRQQIMILFYIVEKKGITTVKEIAKFLQVTPGAVTQFVDGLVENKLVSRKENSLDRRSIYIEATANAKKEFCNFKKSYFKNASRIFKSLSDLEIKNFIELLEKVKASDPDKSIDLNNC